jgi:hypothetical protein
MSRGGRWLVVAMAAVLTAPAVPARSAPKIVLPRAGQVGLGVQGGWGTLLSTGDVGGTFGGGPTIAVRLRYRMRYERGLGLSFEGQRFDIRVPEPFDASRLPDTLSARVNMRAILSGFEFYQMFGTRTRATKMVMVGAGFVQTSGRTVDKQTWYRLEGSDGGYVSVGAGVERFLFRSWALDLSARYMLVMLPEDRLHDVQAAVGFIFYASY